MVTCKIFANLLLTQGYFGSILEDLISNKINSTDDFSWLSRLRYYFKDGAIELKMMYGTIPYGYEYLSAYSKLVMTPLTERCYQILLIALDTHQGMISQFMKSKKSRETDYIRILLRVCFGF